LQKPKRPTALGAMLGLSVYSVENKIQQGTLPFLLLESTKRGSQVKPLRFVPTASAARNKRAGLSQLPLRSCLPSC